MNYLLVSSHSLPRTSARLHFPKLLTKGHPIISPPFDAPSFYIPEDIEPAVTTDDPIEINRTLNVLGYFNHKPYDVFLSGKQRDSYIIPNTFTVKTRKFSTLVNFNALGLSLPKPQPAFVVFQENLECLESIEYTFLMHSEPTLPRKAVYSGYNYVSTDNKISLFVKATIIEQ